MSTRGLVERCLTVTLIALGCPHAVAAIEMRPVASTSEFVRLITSPLGFDIDNDGHREFVFRLESQQKRIEIYGSTGGDVIQLVHAWELPGESAQWVIPTRGIGDSDNDGLSELVLWTSALNVRLLRVYESPTPGTFPSTEPVFEFSNWTTNWFAGGNIADTDGDGRKEIIFGGFDWVSLEDSLVIYENTGDNSYAQTYRLGTIAEPRNLTVVDDLDGDGKPEIVYVAGGMRALESTGDDTYEMIWVQPLVYNGNPVNAEILIDAGDLDGDGLKEILVGGLRTNPPFQYVFFLFESAGDNSIRLAHTFTGPMDSGDWSQGAVADVDGDGKREIILGIAPSVWIYKNVGDDAWELVWTGTTLWSNSTRLGAGDHDGDGKAEVIFRETSTSGTIFEIDPAYAVDQDADGTVDGIDTCPQIANPEQNTAVFDRTVVATSTAKFGWDPAADVLWVRGDLGGVGGYAVDSGGALANADTLTDGTLPGAGTGFYYLLRPDCAVGSWQTAAGSEPGRDAVLP